MCSSDLGLRSLVPTLPLLEDGDAGSDPIQVIGIDGLGPVKAAITTAPFGAFDGEAYVGASVGKRNIVLTIGLHPDWAIQTIEELRQLLYNYFMSEGSAFLYWRGDFRRKGTTHISKANTKALSQSILGSENRFKIFYTSRNGRLWFQFSAMGMSKIVTMRQV